MAMSIYAMNIFKLTKTTCSAITSMIAKYWWGSSENNKKMYWHNWKKMTNSKADGGLGFKDLELFNNALLAKQTWRLINKPSCLMARVLKSIYFPSADILNAKIKPQSSYVWRSLLVGRDLIAKGLRFNIGNGTSITTWKDAWLPLHPPRPLYPLIEPTYPNTMLSEWIKEDGSGWIIDKVQQSFIPHDASLILSLKISSRNPNDHIGWHFNNNGIYSVKSGYWLASQIAHSQFPTVPGLVDHLKDKTWKLKVPNKLRHFVWSILSNSLSIGSNLRRRRITPDAVCKRCFRAEETESHLFFECHYAKVIWRASGLPSQNLSNNNIDFLTKLQECFKYDNSGQLIHFQNLPIWILWRIWKARNILIFQNKVIPWSNTIRYALFDANEWRTLGQDSENQQGHMQDLEKGHWNKPPENWIKCNVDGTFINSTTSTTSGWICRDWRGEFKSAGQATGRAVLSSLESEFQVIISSMQDCWIKGYRLVFFETDSKVLFNILTGKVINFPLQNWFHDFEWWKNKFRDIQIGWINRENNKPADILAKNHRGNDALFLSHNYVPQFLYDAVNDDYLSFLH